MKVYAFQSSGPTELTTQEQLDTPSAGPRLGWGTNLELPPVGGYWRRGDRLFEIGTQRTWVCTGEGIGDVDAMFAAADMAQPQLLGRIVHVQGQGTVSGWGFFGNVINPQDGDYTIDFGGTAFLDANLYTIIGNALGAANGLISIITKNAASIEIRRLVGGVSTAGDFELLLFSAITNI